jgi:hypothetical protein
MPVDDGEHSRRVDVTQIVVHEHVAKAADFTPWNGWAQRCLALRQELSRLGQCLQVAQRRVVKYIVLGQVAARTDARDRGNRIEYVQRMRLAGLVL